MTRLRAHRTRRQVLSDTATLAVSLITLPYSRSIFSQTDRLETLRLSDDMLVVIGPNANAVAAAGNDGVIMVDGGHADWSEALSRAVSEAFGSEPITALFNTHWHAEQTGSNFALGERGAEIIAHENTRLWLGTEVWVRWSDIKYPPLPEIARPTTTFYDSGSIRLGGRNIEYGYMLHAHTDGDIWVFLPDENVLVTGGLVSNDGWPIIDWWTGGWTGGMLDGYDALLEIANADTRIVPANGPVMTLADLRSQQRMYQTIFDRIHEMLRQSLGTDEVLAARPTAEFDDVWGDPELFLTLAFQSTWGHLRDAHSKRMRNIA